MASSLRTHTVAAQPPARARVSDRDGAAPAAASRATHAAAPSLFTHRARDRIDSRATLRCARHLLEIAPLLLLFPLFLEHALVALVQQEVEVVPPNLALLQSPQRQPGGRGGGGGEGGVSAAAADATGSAAGSAAWRRRERHERAHARVIARWRGQKEGAQKWSGQRGLRTRPVPAPSPWSDRRPPARPMAPAMITSGGSIWYGILDESCAVGKGGAGAGNAGGGAGGRSAQLERSAAARVRHEKEPSVSEAAAAPRPRASPSVHTMLSFVAAPAPPPTVPSELAAHASPYLRSRSPSVRPRADLLGFFTLASHQTRFEFML